MNRRSFFGRLFAAVLAPLFQWLRPKNTLHVPRFKHAQHVDIRRVLSANPIKNDDFTLRVKVMMQQQASRGLTRWPVQSLFNKA